MNKNTNNKKNYLDYSSGFVVLGSGLNAIAAIHGILDGGSSNKTIYVIDVGLTSNSNSFKFKNKPKMPSPKFKIKDNEYVYRDFNEVMGIQSKGFDAVGSLAKGGLSNIWGAGIQPYSADELIDFPYKLYDIQWAYEKVFKILTGENIKKNFIQKIDLQNHDLELNEPLLALNYHQTEKNHCELPYCDTGCIKCNKNVFNSSYEIDNLIKKNHIKYISGLFVKKVFKKDGFNFIKCINLNTKEVTLIKANRVYCSLGAISSAKLISKIWNSNFKTNLLHTPGGSFFMFSFKRFHRLEHKILSSKTFSYKMNGLSFEGNIFPFSKNLLVNYFGKNFGYLLYALLGKIFLGRLFIANIYFNSNLSACSIEFKKNITKMESQINPELEKAFNISLKIITKKFLSFGLFVIPFTKKLLLAGQDIHYGGTIPMKETPKKNECNLNGELEGFEKLYITDASSLPFLAPKGNSFNSMVNSYFIAKKSVQKIN